MPDQTAKQFATYVITELFPIFTQLDITPSQLVQALASRGPGQATKRFISRPGSSEPWGVSFSGG